MTIMNRPDETLYRDLLQDYVAPIDDDGFTKHLMSRIERESVEISYAQQHHLRRYVIALSVLIGGAIAALQVPALVRLLNILWPTKSVELPSPPMNVSENFPALFNQISVETLPIWVWPCVIGLGFMLWVTLDNRGFSDI